MVELSRREPYSVLMHLWEFYFLLLVSRVLQQQKMCQSFDAKNVQYDYGTKVYNIAHR